MQFDNSEPELQLDVEAIQKIPIISTILDVVCRTTGMGFVAVARVTEDRWITCSSLDNLQFGLKPGDELKLTTTICNEIKQCGKPVVIDHVALDEHYRQHDTPLMYGFQSYISMPIICKDGSFFGTLCAIDPKPTKLSTPEIMGMFSLFCDLISFHLDAIIKLEKSELNLLQEREERIKVIEQKNQELEKMNKELSSFTYIASHDLQEPLRKITTFSSYILEEDYGSLSMRGKDQFDRLIKSVKRMQQLIDDLLMYTRLQVQDTLFENIALATIIDQVKQDFKEELTQNEVTVECGPLCTAFVIPFQFNQLIQNLFSNSIKFSRKDVRSVILITSSIDKGDPNISKKLLPEKYYCHFTITDNGIGFDNQYNQKIFEIFQRLNGKKEYKGTGVGLAIVKKIVENHNGYITATGELDQGATFHIYLPHFAEELATSRQRIKLSVC